MNAIEKCRAEIQRLLGVKDGLERVMKEQVSQIADLEVEVGEGCNKLAAVIKDRDHLRRLLDVVTAERDVVRIQLDESRGALELERVVATILRPVASVRAKDLMRSIAKADVRVDDNAWVVEKASGS